MQPRSIIAMTLAVTTALSGLAATGVTAKAKPKVTKVSCTLELFAQGAPNPSGIHFGHASCPRTFGKGLHHNSYTVTPTGPGQGNVAAKFKNAYDLGTVRGSGTMAFTATSPANITYTGPIRYTRGTGAYRRVRGTGTIRCTTTDGGAHKSCTVDSKVTGL
jgi:hypothetical protein